MSRVRMNRKEPLKEREVAALVSFLGDSSEVTLAIVKDHLKQILRQNPSYRNLLENPQDPHVALRAKLFLEETRLEELKEAFRDLALQGPDLDLERGAILLAQSESPDLLPQTLPRALDRLAEGVEKELNVQEGPSSRDVMIIRRYLFEHLGFSGNERNYYDPDNSYLHRVLERKTGIPISLSCVYLFIAARLDLPAYGVGLPGHFVVGHRASPGVIYIDPYHRGRILTRQDCIDIVRQRGIPFQDAFLAPTPAHQILTRLIANLVNVYTEQQRPERAQWLTQVLALFENA
jgi:regulator of sirC expression with transglutaminase-like and TPR domain